MGVLTREQFKKRRRIRKLIKYYSKLAAFVMAALLVIAVFIYGGCRVIRRFFGTGTSAAASKVCENDLKLKQELGIETFMLTKNEYSRPCNSLKSVKKIVLHYAADSGKTAADVRNYYESLKDGTTKTYDSCHFIVGLSGEIVQCIPTDECALASGKYNDQAISITFCHLEPDGYPSDATYTSLSNLVISLCKTYNLTQDDIIRHYDIDESSCCPKYFVDSDVAWTKFIQTVKDALE
jgi:N-acetylmuramoyl-L-alanine amidase